MVMVEAGLPFTGASLAQLTANGLITGSSYALVAVGFGMIIHMTHRFHIAYAAIYALTTFLAAQLQISLGMPFAAALVVSTLCGVVVAVGMERLVYSPLIARVGHEALFPVFIASLGVSTAIEALINIIWQNPITLNVTTTPIVWGPLNLTNITVQSVIVTWVMLSIVFAILKWTSLGRRIRAVRVNPELSTDYGINPSRIYVVVFVIGTVIGGVGSVYLAAQTAPASDIGENLVLYAITAAMIVGASRNILLIAALALLMGLIQSWTTFVISATWSSLVIFAILLLYVLGKAALTIQWSRLLRRSTGGQLPVPAVRASGADALAAETVRKEA